MLVYSLGLPNAPLSDVPMIVAIDFKIDPADHPTLVTAPTTTATQSPHPAPRVAREYAMYISSNRMQALQQHPRGTKATNSGRLCYHCLGTEQAGQTMIRYTAYRPMKAWHPHRQIVKQLFPQEICFHQGCGDARARATWLDQTAGCGYVPMDKDVAEATLHFEGKELEECKDGVWRWVVVGRPFSEISYKTKMLPDDGRTPQAQRLFNYAEYVQLLWDEAGPKSSAETETSAESSAEGSGEKCEWTEMAEACSANVKASWLGY